VTPFEIQAEAPTAPTVPVLGTAAKLALDEQHQGLCQGHSGLSHAWGALSQCGDVTK
jgi:hypothetical protein